MPTDNFSQVHFSNGEGLVQTDFTDAQKFLDAKIWDQLVHNSMPSYAEVDPLFTGQDGTDHAISFAYCLNPGAAYLRPGTGNNKIQIAPGTLVQKLGTITGDDPKCIAFTFAGTEEWTIANGDGSNPRVDLLQMKLEYVEGDPQSRDFEDAVSRVVTTTSMNKKRRVQCTLFVKAGTPAASPTIPSLDTGCVPVGMVLVGTSWTSATACIFGVDTAGANAVVHDLRMPICVKAYAVAPVNFHLVSNWSLASANRYVVPSNVTNELQVLCPHVGTGRMVGFSITVKAATGSISAGQTTIAKLSNLVATPLNSTVWVSPTTSILSHEGDFGRVGDHAPSAGPTIITNGTESLNVVPVWTNGRRCPYEYQRLLAAGARPNDRLMLRIVNANLSGGDPWVAEVVFYIATGL